MRTKTVGSYLVLVACIVCLFASVVVAQVPAVTLTVSPPTFELSANPGDQLKNSVRLENPTEFPRLVDVEFRNFTAYGEDGSVDLTEESTAYSLASWLSISENQVTVPAKGSHTFTFYVNVPPNAEPGGHFGSIVFKTTIDDNESRDQSGAKIQQELGALVLVKVAGDIKENLAVESFTTPKKVWEKGPIVLETRVKNNGNVHTKTQGNITISNMFGKQVATVPLEQKNILPGAVRKLNNDWNPGGFAFGRYTAHLSVAYGSENQVATATQTFWVIPYKLIALVAIVIALVSFIIVRYRKRFGAAFKAFRGKR